MTADPYTFRPVVAGDLPMLHAWLRTPDVARWWPDPDEQYAGLIEDLAGTDMTMLIVAHQGRDFAYSQHSNIHGWGADFTQGLPDDCRAVDSFIGVPEMLGLGHGPAFLRRLAATLREDYSMVAVDPDVANIRAQRAYEKAGFRRAGVVDTPDGLSQLMLFDG